MPVSFVFDGALSWLSTIVAAALKYVWGLLAAFALTSPDVTLLPQVQAVSSRSLLVVNTVYVLAVLAAGILVMARENLQVRYGIGELAPRLVIGLVAANLATTLCRGMIEIANALTQALTGDSITSSGTIQQLNSAISTAALSTSGPGAFLGAVIAVLLLVLTLMLLATWLVRVGLLVVLTGIAPLALACHALPHTDGAARLWWRSMAATLGVVTVQAFALHTTLTVFLSPQANLPALGIPMDPAGTINLFIVACLLWTTVRIPTLARRFVVRGGSSPITSMVRVLVVQQLTRGLVRGGGGGRLVSRVARGRP